MTVSSANPPTTPLAGLVGGTPPSRYGKISPKKLPQAASARVSTSTPKGAEKSAKPALGKSAGARKLFATSKKIK
jgi:hypothetical protein